MSSLTLQALHKTSRRQAFGHRSLLRCVGGVHQRCRSTIAASPSHHEPTAGLSSNNTSEHDLFNYTSGRWLYNENLRLAERHLEFNVQELKNVIAKAANKREDDIESFVKLAEGGFNRVFQATMGDGLQILARLPYKSTLPKRYAVASEVATIDLVRAHGIPAPRVLSYNVNADNAVGSEYIVMEMVTGNEIGHRWYDLSTKERKTITLDVAKLEASMLSIPFPASGSIYYKKDLLDTDQSVDIAGHDGFCIGPNVALSWWVGGRDSLIIDRGPFTQADDVMIAGAIKEQAWIQQFGRPRFPFDRHRRELTNYTKSSCEEHYKNLDEYKQIAKSLVPSTEALLRPVIRHPDLQPHNIFVSDEFNIVGLIDWQHCSVLPLYLHSQIPKYWQNTSDEPVVIEKPSLPSDYDQLDAVEQAQAMEELRQRQIHLLYLGGTTRFNPQLIDALLTEGLAFKRRIYEDASAPWEGDNIALKADLVLATQNWSGLTAQKGPLPCPISFTEEEANEALRVDLLRQDLDASFAGVIETIGIGSDGWVPHERYHDAVEKNACIRHQLVESNEELTVQHYPFDDHDENE